MYLGIDFGTCYSSAAIALNGKKTQLVREPLKHGYSFPIRGREGRHRPPLPFRTVHETFTSHGS
jgi:molecular chaperone DnaK (HSP70)